MTPSRTSDSAGLLAQEPPRQPRGAPIRELFGWRIVSCSDARHSWVEIEAPKPEDEAFAIEVAPGTAQLIAEAIREVATHAGDCAVLRFIAEDRSERRGTED